MSVWNSKGLLEFIEGLVAFYQQTREELIGEVGFAIGSVPPKSSCFQASQSTETSSLTSSNPRLVSKLRSILGTMVEISEEKIQELHGWDAKNLMDFIARWEEWLKKIRSIHILQSASDDRNGQTRR
jgi:hypothetical protein